jgi:hypothetical protein
MATSEKKIAANQRNALASTGPKSPTGKASSSKNATRHGLFAKSVVADHEDRGAFVALLDDLRRQFDPQTELEQHLTEKLAIAIWRGRRLAIAETAQINADKSEPHIDFAFLDMKTSYLNRPNIE